MSHEKRLAELGIALPPPRALPVLVGGVAVVALLLAVQAIVSAGSAALMVWSR